MSRRNCRPANLRLPLLIGLSVEDGAIGYDLFARSWVPEAPAFVMDALLTQNVAC